MSQFSPPSQPGQSGPDQRYPQWQLQQSTPDSQWQSPSQPLPPQPQWQQPQQPYPPQFPPQQQWQQPVMQPMQTQQPPKKRRAGRAVAIGCGSIVALIVLIAVIAAALSHGGTTTNSNTNTSSNTPTTNQQSTPATTINQIGKPIIVDATWTVTVNSVKTSTGDSVFTPKSGKIYVVVDVTIKNTSSGSQSISSLGNFTLKDSSGQQYDETFTDIGKPPDGSIAAGELLRGQLVYEVPTSQHSFSFSFQADLGGTDLTEWKLNI